MFTTIHDVTYVSRGIYLHVFYRDADSRKWVWQYVEEMPSAFDARNQIRRFAAGSNQVPARYGDGGMPMP